MIYTRAFVEIYNWHYKGLVYKTYGMIKLKNYAILKIEKLWNLGIQQVYKIFEVL